MMSGFLSETVRVFCRLCSAGITGGDAAGSPGGLFVSAVIHRAVFWYVKMEGNPHF
ncbi:hypothetical protein BACCAP_00359 [Pseudoflavonifractor capillosus ATCC 29799]|uniref:Uncharacterized protein n=1 Tax=Pseudoflavonifractor capillosus ATCC 29799 TaxID=411467 RepID=A6NQ89_9FIRM|nr:hypothetical protein BACCAP_00359 [Pseudoflavonifractor capillosus ATCC 29799]